MQPVLQELGKLYSIILIIVPNTHWGKKDGEGWQDLSKRQKVPVVPGAVHRKQKKTQGEHTIKHATLLYFL